MVNAVVSLLLLRRVGVMDAWIAAWMDLWEVGAVDAGLKEVMLMAVMVKELNLVAGEMLGSVSLNLL